ncbi:MAG: hypothetical protein OQK07_12040, partial [Rhodospirillales bacterium]|nr:hypothetical protein [Rhodospirillales bacterium]
TFCDWGSATQTKIFQFSMDRLEREMRWFSDRKIEFIFCCDANFGILKRDVDIARMAAAVREETDYPRALSVQNTKNARERAYLTQKILSDAGLNKGVTLSMQSINKEALANIKRENISLDIYDDLQKRFTADGVATYSDLILGLPGETYDSFADGAAALMDSGQHNRIQFNNLSILPNAEMADPEYRKKFGIVTVETEILNMHGQALAAGEVAEIEELVVGTASMPAKDWRRTRAFGWMCALLHFDKLLQIPFILIHEMTGISYRDIIEAFLEVDRKDFPVVGEIRDFFMERAGEVQKGGHEHFYSKEWLNIYWPDDEYILIRLSTEGLLDAFYKEAATLLENILEAHMAGERIPVLHDAIALNRAMMKLPGQDEDIVVETAHNVLEVYQAALRGILEPVENGKFAYTIERSKDSWADWPTWCREVVWFGNKKGAYLYGSVALEKYYAGHY